MNYCPLCLQGFSNDKGFHMCPENRGYSVRLVSLEDYEEDIESLNFELDWQSSEIDDLKEELEEATNSKQELLEKIENEIKNLIDQLYKFKNECSVYL